MYTKIVEYKWYIIVYCYSQNGYCRYEKRGRASCFSRFIWIIIFNKFNPGRPSSIFLLKNLLATRFSGNFWSQTSSHWILPRGSQRPECFLSISKSSSRKPSTAQAFKSRWESYFIYMPNNPTPFHLNILLPNTIISS